MLLMLYISYSFGKSDAKSAFIVSVLSCADLDLGAVCYSARGKAYNPKRLCKRANPPNWLVTVGAECAAFLIEAKSQISACTQTKADSDRAYEFKAASTRTALASSHHARARQKKKINHLTQAEAAE